MPTYDCIFHNSNASKQYSRCRYVDEQVLRHTSEAIWTVCGVVSARIKQCRVALVEAGAGSGRLFLPILRSRLPSFNQSLVVGLDIAQPMLEALTKRIEEAGPFPLRSYLLQRWDIQDPYPRLDVPVAVIFSLATFHILQQWRHALSRAVDVLAKSGRLVLIKEINQFMHQTEGFEGDSELVEINPLLSAFMREYHRLRSAFGLPFVRDGILYSNFELAIQELKTLGFDLLEVVGGPDFSWQKPHNYSDLLLTLEERVITTWGTDLPDKERHAIANNLRVWLQERRVNLDTKFTIPARFEINVFGSSTSHRSI
jgi:SAM-dependent methyltransferase